MRKARDGDTDIQPGPVGTDQAELGKFKTMLPGKRKPQVESRAGFQPPSPQPSTLMPCRTCTTSHYTLGSWQTVNQLKGHKIHALLLFLSIFPNFSAYSSSISHVQSHLPRLWGSAVPSNQTSWPPDHIMITAWGRPESYPGISHTCCLTISWMADGCQQKRRYSFFNDFTFVVERKTSRWANTRRDNL